MWRAGHVSAMQAQEMDLPAICMEDFYRSVVDADPALAKERSSEASSESYAAFLKRIPDFPIH
jgi:hypothetical protein